MKFDPPTNFVEAVRGKGKLHEWETFIVYLDANEIGNPIIEEILGPILSNSLATTFTGTVLMSMFCGTSLAKLFGLVNTLQIIHFIPLLTLHFPSHTR